MGSAWIKREPVNPDDAENARALLQRIVLAYDLCDLLDPGSGMNAGAMYELEQAMEAARSHLLRRPAAGKGSAPPDATGS